MSPTPGTLYVVATPIGNLGDVTERALATLRDVDLILAEDTRMTKHMLEKLDSRDVHAQFIRMDERTSGIQLLNIVDQIAQGLTAALVSDAGTPGVSDPGGAFIEACKERSITIVPIPGPSALTALLSVADFPVQPVAFYGFLPKKKGRETTLRKLGEMGGKYGLASIVLYESPERVLRTLADLAATIGETTHLVIGRELTKLHEEIWYGSVSEALVHYTDQKPRGEFTLLIQLTRHKA